METLHVSMKGVAFFLSAIFQKLLLKSNATILLNESWA